MVLLLDVIYYEVGQMFKCSQREKTRCQNVGDEFDGWHVVLLLSGLALFQ